DGLDLAIDDLEGFHDRERVGPFEQRLHGTAIGQLILVEAVVMIEEGRADDDAALLVDDREAALAQLLVDAVDAELELLLAAFRDSGGAGRIAIIGGGADAIFQ